MADATSRNSRHQTHAGCLQSDMQKVMRAGIEPADSSVPRDASEASTPPGRRRMAVCRVRVLTPPHQTAIYHFARFVALRFVGLYGFNGEPVHTNCRFSPGSSLMTIIGSK